MVSAMFRKYASSVIRKMLAWRGYEIHSCREKFPYSEQPDQFQQVSIADHWLPAAEIFNRNPSRAIEIMYTSRQVLRKIEYWLNDETYKNSLWKYGLPMGNQSINCIELRPTYTDLILFLSKELNQPLTYLELGVSAGKNFLQVAQSTEGGVLIGIDIEEINPVLEKFFSNKRITREWKDTFIDYKNVTREKDCSTIQYTCNNNQIVYISGNKFSNKTWDNVKGVKFNIIFSDACHTPESIKHEFDMIMTMNLLRNDEFIFVWDDLNGSMVNTFSSLSESLTNVYRGAKACVLSLYGSYGYEQKPHTIGLVYKLPGFKN